MLEFAYGPQLATGTLLKPETFQARTRFTQLDGGDIGYGLGITRMGQWLGHNGAVLGFTDQLGYLPDKHATVAVAVNQYGPGTAQLLPVDAALLWFDLVDALTRARDWCRPRIPKPLSHRSRRPRSSIRN
ncbi:hypothetical protein ACFXPS_22285 [Nocardia sp. NPDC059091]|uniref:hypothetical protein n=1 Tax=unclassified Nocardia TaxID=2637762 RepID=UPI00369FA4E9